MNYNFLHIQKPLVLLLNILGKNILMSFKIFILSVIHDIPLDFDVIIKTVNRNYRF